MDSRIDWATYNVEEEEYLDLLGYVKAGDQVPDRTGTGTRSIFGPQIEFKLTDSFPLLTTKTVPLRLIFEELNWFLSGSTRLRPLLEVNVNIWNEWPFMAWLQRENIPIPIQGTGEWKLLLETFISRIKTDDDFDAKHGDLGDVYGKQWRSYQTADGRTIDQVVDTLRLMKEDPHSRRMLITGWNPGALPDLEMLGRWDMIIDNGRACLPPCHSLFQFNIANRKLNCKLYQRSADIFLGVPFNIASYSLLTCMIAHQLDLLPGRFIHTFGDLHMYNNHVTAVETQLKRTATKFPILKFNRKPASLFDYKWDDIELVGYEPQPTISAPVAI